MGDKEPMKFNMSVDGVAGSRPVQNQTVMALWTLLDDIDTASDMFKPQDLASYEKFYRYVLRKADERHQHIKSDGYQLYER